MWMKVTIPLVLGGAVIIGLVLFTGRANTNSFSYRNGYESGYASAVPARFGDYRDAACGANQVPGWANKRDWQAGCNAGYTDGQ